MFRVLFGALMAAQVWMLYPDIMSILRESPITLPYRPLAFVQPLPEPFMTGVFALGSLAALALAAGVWYRASVFIHWLCFTYLFLLDKSYFNNHYYLFSLFGLMLLFVSADRWGTISRAKNERNRTRPVAYWQIFLFRLLIAIVFLFGAWAKVQKDWMVFAQPVQLWMDQRADWPIIGPVVASTIAGYFIAWYGLLFDLSMAFALWFVPKKWYTLAAFAAFNLANSVIFGIGLFPYMMLAALVIFFEPEWFRKVYKAKFPYLGRLRPEEYQFRLMDFSKIEWRYPESKKRLVLALMAVFFLIQIVMPLRRYVLYEGRDPGWTNRAHYFAWRMMLRSKGGVSVRFTIKDGASAQRKILYDTQFMARRHYRLLKKDPVSVHRYAQYLAEYARDSLGYAQPEVYVWTWNQLNQHPPQHIIDPDINLAAAPFHPMKKAEWIAKPKFDRGWNAVSNPGKYLFGFWGGPEKGEENPAAGTKRKSTPTD